MEKVVVGTQILFASGVQAAWGVSDFLPFLSHVIPRSTRWQPSRAPPATVASPPHGFPSMRERTSSSVPRSAVRRSSRAAGPPATSSCTRRRSKVSPPPPHAAGPQKLSQRLPPTQRCSSQPVSKRIVQARGQRAEGRASGRGQASGLEILEGQPGERPRQGDGSGDLPLQPSH